MKALGSFQSSRCFLCLFVPEHNFRFLHKLFIGVGAIGRPYPGKGQWLRRARAPCGGAPRPRIGPGAPGGRHWRGAPEPGPEPAARSGEHTLSLLTFTRATRASVDISRRLLRLLHKYLIAVSQIFNSGQTIDWWLGWSQWALGSSRGSSSR